VPTNRLTLNLYTGVNGSNGVNNVNFKTYKDAYDDSRQTAVLSMRFVNYVYGEGLIDKAG
jgi:hypothetical protein